jgi:hypothetical protein
MQAAAMDSVKKGAKFADCLLSGKASGVMLSLQAESQAA